MNHSTEPHRNELPPDESTGDLLSLRLNKFCEGARLQMEKDRRERFEFMASQPQTQPCKIHSDVHRPIDDKETEKATRYFIQTTGKPVAGYAPCPKCIQDAKNQELKKFGVPENLIHATFDNLQQDGDGIASHIEMVKEFCEKRTGFLILSGGFGTGKTHLAVAALRQVKSGWLVKQATLLRLLRATYSDRNADDPIERAQNARLLILDEVGLSSGGRDELPMLHEILDHRHGSRLPTIITTNLPFENLSGVLGERMADRLRESAFRVLVFAGSSHRREARERYFDSPPAEPPFKKSNVHDCL